VAKKARTSGSNRSTKPKASPAKGGSRSAPVDTFDPTLPLGDIRHPAAKRKNNPPAKIAAEGSVPLIAKASYAYNPHLPPILRFDQTGAADHLETRLSDAAAARAAELLAVAQKRPLKPDEAAELANLLESAASARITPDPWLEWTGKREMPGFAVDPVALHIHERVSAQAILKVAARQDINKSLFADPEQEYHQAVQFYRHDIDWSNRLILGDSLQVMSSLARREDLAGKVQMIYMDPPYGIKFASNFQPEVGKRDVKDKQEDLTREPEMVRAYRDTWHLGIHSYLSYLRDRLIVARELLADTGSIFVQISDENVHLLRNVMDEVFGGANCLSQITFKKTSSSSGNLLSTVADYLVWYARDATKVKYRQLFTPKQLGESGADQYTWADVGNGGERRRLSQPELAALTDARTVFRPDQLTSQRPAQEGDVREFAYCGRAFTPGRGTFKSDARGLSKLANAERLLGIGNTLCYVRYIDDFAAIPIANVWEDTVTSGFGDPKRYVVQTNPSVIARCMLMTSDPGDLVLDPTCGSGTTAYVAENWGRRWITIDTSRVAVAIARQRLLTAKFDSYETKGTRSDAKGNPIPDPSSGFIYKSVPHITLKSIAQNVALDPIFARHEPILDAALKKANAELAAALKKDPSLRTRLGGKLAKKQRDQGKRAITDADRRRWTLPPENRDKHVKYTVDAKFAGWYHWEVPFDTDAEWPKALADAVSAYRAMWRAKMDEVNACIAASAKPEDLVDQPEPVKGVTRVSGPFSVEAVQPPEMSLGDVMEGFADAPEELGATFHEVSPRNALEVANIGAYLDQMIRFLRADGVRFLGNKQMKWTRLEALFESGGTAAAQGFHAEGRWTEVGKNDPDPDGPTNVGVVIGPQYGPVTAKMIEELIRPAGRLYEHLVIAGFNFTAEAQSILGESPHPKMKLHLAHIRPDINPEMDGLLKESPRPGSGQLFTVFGQPRIAVRGPGKKGADDEGMYTVTMEGVDIYNPVDDTIASAGPSKVAAWFLDSDYDGRTFCITQAFFPNRDAWEKLQKALNGKDGPIDADRFEAFSGTTSLAFPKGEHARVAVKVIDPRGNEVMAVERL